MANVFKKDKTAIRNLLQSKEVMQATEAYARRMASGGEVKSFVGFDRAKSLVRTSEKGDRG